MSAVIRAGGGRGRPGGDARRRKPAAYAPAKLGSVGSAGLPPATAAWAAGVALALGLVLVMLSGGRLRAATRAVEAGAQSLLARTGLRVSKIAVEGASDFARADILRAVGAPDGASMLGVDLEAVRDRVERIGWVRSATVVRLWPDTLVVAVKERPRLAVWQHGAQASVVDQDGQVIPEADPGRFAELPLIVGDGANESASSILPEIAARPRLAERLEALVRVDARRWDLRLKDGALIQLPADGEDSALIRLDQLDQRDRLLELGFQRIDLRDPQATAVRPRGAPAVAVASAAPASKTT